MASTAPETDTSCQMMRKAATPSVPNINASVRRRPPVLFRRPPVAVVLVRLLLI
jgi:hypothetical protein